MINWEEQNDKAPLEGDLSDFDETVSFHRADDTLKEGLWDNVVREHHYLESENMIGRGIKYFITLGRKLIGAISFCDACLKLGPRDLYVGWDDDNRKKYLQHLINNNRFLIFPWINIKNLASHVISESLKEVRLDWIKKYQVEPYMVETFVDAEMRLGFSYMAANWVNLGVANGFGKLGNSFIRHGSEKEIYVIVLNRRFSKKFKPDLNRLVESKALIMKLLKNNPVEFPTILKAIGVEGVPSDILLTLLGDHIERYEPYLGRKEHFPHMVAMIKGRLSEIPRKTPELVAVTFEGNKGEKRNFLNFMSKSLFDDRAMLEEYQRDLGALLSQPGGMITADVLDFRKKGMNSVGVTRQFSHNIGKTDNCQVAVVAGYSSQLGAGPSDITLYIPEKWLNDEHAFLRKQCQVPQDTIYKSKSSIILEMIEKAAQGDNFKIKYVGLSNAFMSDDSVLDSLPKGLVYFGEITENYELFVRSPKDSKDSSSELSLRTVNDIISDSDLPWQSVIPKEKGKGLVYPKDMVLKVHKAKDGQPAGPIWLYLRLFADKTYKCAITNKSQTATPASLLIPATLRWAMTERIKECRELLGIAHYEVRTFPAWRRQMLFTFISHLYINKLRRKFLAKDVKSPDDLVAL
jgi:SRSO17 transposase